MVAEFAKFWGKMPASTRNRIHFLGKISDQEKRDLLNAGDIFAMPSRVDSFGIAYLEAWLNGKPVISANAWGVNDLVENGVDGMVVEFGHVPQLAQAIAHLLDHPDQARQMGQRGAEKAQTHFWAGKVRKIESIYERLVT
jgi:glycosyltransferase involved in cell wall biosynthesis